MLTLSALRPGLDVQRQKLVEAAFAVLGRSALEDTSVEDVLRQAQVSRQTFYRAFPDLDALFAEVRRQIDARLEEILASRMGSAATPAEGLTAYLDAIFEAALDAGPAVLALNREEKRPGSPFYGATAKRQASQATLVSGWALVRFGLKISPRELAAVFSACHELCVNAVAARRPQDAAAAKDCARALGEGLLLLCGARQGLWSVSPRSARAATLLPKWLS